MARLRFSLAGLAGLVALTAVSCAALVNANMWVASGFLTVVFLLLVFASIRAVLRPSGFWAGFAIAGWVYVAVALGPLTGQFGENLATTLVLGKLAHAMPQSAANLSTVQYLTLTSPPLPAVAPTPAPMNVTTTAIDLAVPAFNGTPSVTYTAPITPTYRPVITAVPAVNSDYVDAFVRIGQALCTLVLAVLGGIVAMGLAARPSLAERPASEAA